MLHAPYYNLVIKVGNEIFATKEHLIWFEAQFFALNLKFLWFITDLSEFRHEFNKTTACFCAPRVIWPFQELAIFQIFHHFFFFQRHVLCFDAVVVLFYFIFSSICVKITSPKSHFFFNFQINLRSRCCSQFKTFVLNKINRKKYMLTLHQQELI